MLGFLAAWALANEVAIIIAEKRKLIRMGDSLPSNTGEENGKVNQPQADCGSC
jgi:hypothetical protein